MPRRCVRVLLAATALLAHAERLSDWIAPGPDSQLAEWAFDPRRRHVVPADDDAARLSLPEADLAELVPALRAPAPPRATVTPITSRLSAATAPPAEPHPGPAPAHEARAHEARAQEVRGPETRRPAPAVPAARASADPGEAKPGPAQPGPARAGQAQPGQARAGQAQAGEARGSAAQAAQDPAAEPETTAPAADTQEAPAPPRRARKAAGGRPRRSSVPSWDEIMFGTSRQPD